MSLKQLFIICILISSFGCGSKTSVSFDSTMWKSDKNGCKKERLTLYKDVLNNQDELLGLNNRQIISLLGMPERNELYQRNQKFFIYTISPSSKCNNDYQGESLFMFIRFNAVGLSQELFIGESPDFEE